MCSAHQALSQYVRKPRAICLYSQAVHSQMIFALIISLPQGRDKQEWRDEQAHQLGSQLSNTPYYADSPKRHGTLQDSDYSDGSPIVSTPWPQPTATKTERGNSPPWAKTSPKLPKLLESHPHEPIPLPNSQNCCNHRRKYYNSSRLESRNWQKMFEVSRTRISFFSLLPLSIHTS